MSDLLKKSARSALVWASFALGAIGISVAYAALNFLTPVGTAISWSWVSSGEWNKMVANFTTIDGKLEAVVPTWAVMAFNLASCPNWWSAFSQANGKTVVGVGNDGQGNAYSLLNSWGEARHTLTVAEMPNHAHGFSIGTTDDNNSPWNVALLQLWDNGPFSYANFTTAATGGGGSHENRMPYVALLYCVKN